MINISLICAKDALSFKNVFNEFSLFDINQPNLPTPFHSVLVSISVFMALSTIFHFIEFSRQLSVFSLRSSGLISALLVLSTAYLFMKVSFSPDIILCG